MNREKLFVPLAVLLFLSLSANFFMGGIVLGNRMSGPPPGHAAMKDAEFRKSISAEDQKFLKDVMAKNKKTFEKLRKAIDAARKDVKDAAHAEPFDQDDLTAALTAEQEAKINFLRHREQVRQDVIGGLSADARKTLEKLSPPVRRAPKHDDDMPFIWEEGFLYGFE